MSDLLIVDAGPLVALLARRDQFHQWVVEAAKSQAAPMLSTEPVLAEAAHLLRREGVDSSILLEWIRRGAIRIGLQLQEEAGRLQELMRAYADRPMSLADATLVRLSELHTGAKVFTTDSDFTFYRRLGNQAIPLLAPSAFH